MRRTRLSTNGKRHANSGFSLTEIIAVLAIIAILATAVITVTRYATKKGRIAKGTATLEKLTLSIGVYKQDFGMYIPESAETANGESLQDVLSKLQWPSDFRDARGRIRSKPSLQKYDKASEILFFFLQEMFDVVNFSSATRQANKGIIASLPRKKAYVKFKRNELADTDGDEVPEIIDGWGMPFLYVAADRRRGDSVMNLEPHEGKNPGSFSLYSFGPDKLGYYDAKQRSEKDYPVGDLDFDGQNDSNDDAIMRKRISQFAQREGYSSDKATQMANKDNLTNWQRQGP